MKTCNLYLLNHCVLGTCGLSLIEERLITQACLFNVPEFDYFHFHFGEQLILTLLAFMNSEGVFLIADEICPYSVIRCR